MFPASEIKSIEGHLCNKESAVQWYLVVDKYEFHVYVAAVCSEFQVRIDWHQDSTLTYRPFHFDPLEQNIPVASSRWFCKPCTASKLRHSMHEYQLFSFNCRTLSYLILSEVQGFDPNMVYGKFKQLHIMCGLEPLQCFSLDEIHRYVAYKKENKTSCVLF